MKTTSIMKMTPKLRWSISSWQSISLPQSRDIALQDRLKKAVDNVNIVEEKIVTLCILVEPWGKVKSLATGPNLDKGIKSIPVYLQKSSKGMVKQSRYLVQQRSLLGMMSGQPGQTQKGKLRRSKMTELVYTQYYFGSYDGLDFNSMNQQVTAQKKTGQSTIVLAGYGSCVFIMRIQSDLFHTHSIDLFASFKSSESFIRSGIRSMTCHPHTSLPRSRE